MFELDFICKNGYSFNLILSFNFYIYFCRGDPDIVCGTKCKQDGFLTIFLKYWYIHIIFHQPLMIMILIDRFSLFKPLSPRCLGFERRELCLLTRYETRFFCLNFFNHIMTSIFSRSINSLKDHCWSLIVSQFPLELTKTYTLN